MSKLANKPEALLKLIIFKYPVWLHFWFNGFFSCDRACLYD